MSKLFLLSVIVALLTIPARLSREKNAARGLRKVITSILVFNLFYVFGLYVLYGRL